MRSDERRSRRVDPRSAPRPERKAGTVAQGDAGVVQLARWPRSIVVVITVLWTIPTFGLFVTSIRPPADVANSGWWTFFTHPRVHPGELPRRAVRRRRRRRRRPGAVLRQLVRHHDPGALFPLAIASMAAYALAWVRFRGSDLDLLHRSSRCRSCRCRWRWSRCCSSSPGTSSSSACTSRHRRSPARYRCRCGSRTRCSRCRWPSSCCTTSSPSCRSDLIEAARVDGASHFQIFRTIVLPLSTPAIASFAIFQFLWVWNDLLVALTFAGGSTDGRAAHRAAGAADRRVRQQVGAADRRRVHLDRRPADRVLLAAAVLRPRPARRAPSRAERRRTRRPTGR